MSGPTSVTRTPAQLGELLARPWTPAEREVWRILEQGLLGYTFRRHAVLNGILVGFYCPELGLVLQLHEAGAGGSKTTQETLAKANIKVAHLDASEVNRSNLVEAIEKVVGRGRLWPED
jgi:very-short-patch-repair endonuclease